MDTIFLLGEQERNNHLRTLMHSFGCTYICMWFYLPHPSNCLFSSDGQFQEEINQARSSSYSSTSPVRRLFDEYRQNPLLLKNDHVPGSAFTNRRPYVEVKEMELQTMAHVDVQRLFYQEARIKTAVFMGCRSGEIEVGWSNVPQFNIQEKMRNSFHDDFSLQSPIRELSQQIDPNRPSSSSSSLRSLTVDSPDSSLLFNVPTTFHLQEPQKEALTSSTDPLPQAIQSLQPLLPNTSTSPLHEIIQYLPAKPTTTNPLQQVIQSLATRSRTPHQQPTFPSFAPTREGEDEAMTRAILEVLTSPSSPTSSTTPSTRNFSQVDQPVSQEARAFKRFTPSLTPRARNVCRRISMIKRAITYYRRLNILRREHLLAAKRPTTTQLHHMISERKRRGKINESFQALRSLLPPDNKKDKASLLTRTREYLTTLKAQVTELSRTKDQLEAQFFRVREAVEEVSESSAERVAVRVTHVPESTSEQRVIDVQISLRGEYPITDMVIRVLEFLKLNKNVNLVSMEASTFAAKTSSINRVILRLKVEEDDWDESGFQQALKRVVSNLAH